MKPPVLEPFDDQPGQFFFFCPGCDTWHLINTDPERSGPCHTLGGGDQQPTIRPSVLVNAAAAPGVHRCHSYVTAGQIEFLPDCTHGLAGKTVALPAAL